MSKILANRDSTNCGDKLNDSANFSAETFLANNFGKKTSGTTSPGLLIFPYNLQIAKRRVPKA